MKLYKDYTKESEYFSDDSEELMKEEIATIEKNKKYFVWVQEFSKKIVVIAFWLYLITSVFSLVLVYLSFKEGIISGIDTLISETNATFREVVGGYIIKAGVENACKIAGNYYVGVSNAKLSMLRDKLAKNNPNVDLESNTEDDEILTDSGDTTY